MTNSSLRVISDTSSHHGETASSISFSQFIYLDLRHELGIGEVVIASDVSARQRRLIEEHIQVCGARKSIRLVNSNSQNTAAIH